MLEEKVMYTWYFVFINNVENFILPNNLSLLPIMHTNTLIDIAAIGTAHPELLNQLVTICKGFIKNGTPKQAKHAVKCLHMNTTETQV